jgi:hypothetical protein
MSVNNGIFATLNNGTESLGTSGWWGQEEHITKATPVFPATPPSPYGGTWSKDKNGDWVLAIPLQLTVYTSWWGGQSPNSDRHAVILVKFPGDFITDSSPIHEITYWDPNANNGQGGYVTGEPPLLDPRFNDLSQGQVYDPQYYDATGKPILTLSGGPTSFSNLLTLLNIPNQGPTDPYNTSDPYGAWYNYQVSLLDGDTLISLNPYVQYTELETGSGGTITIEGGSNSTLYLWQPKNVIWTSEGANNSIDLNPEMGAEVPAPGDLVLNLLTGVGTNPFGGTLNVQHVNNIYGDFPGAAGEYIICNNDGDIINGPNAAMGNALIIGGTGNDSLTGSESLTVPITSVLVAGPGVDTLVGGVNYGSGTTNIFAYNLGVDTITNFRAGTGSGDLIDLSAVPGITGFADVQLLMTQSGSDTIINFGGGHTITLKNVTEQNLTAGNFLFQPVAAFVRSPRGEADSGQTVQLTLAMSGAVTVNTSGGSPFLTLSNGVTATYDAAASSSSGHIIVFDYVVGANDHSRNLAISNFNPNGAIIADANGHSVDFSRVLNQPLSLQINPSALTVTSLSPSKTGEVDAGQQVQLTLTMSEAFTFNFFSYPTVTLNDGATASGSFSGTSLVFTYNVGPNDHTSNLQITSVNLNGTTVQDANGYVPNFSGALNINTGVQIGPPLYVTSVATSATGEADAGQTVHLTLTMSEGVKLSAGPPSLTLSNNATATFDSALSNLPNGVLVFDYTVGSSDHSPNLEISAVNPNGATIQDGGGHPADFSAALNKPTSLEIGAAPLAVSLVSASPTGQVGTNQDVLISVQMNEAVSNASGDLQLNDGGTAYFDTAASNLSSGDLVLSTWSATPRTSTHPISPSTWPSPAQPQLHKTLTAITPIGRAHSMSASAFRSDPRLLSALSRQNLRRSRPMLDRPFKSF